MSYNPSDVGQKGRLFGLPYTVENAELLMLPVHLDVTVSYSDGTAQAPDSILEESSQLDLSLLSIKEPWMLKMAMSERIVGASENENMRLVAADLISALEKGEAVDMERQDQINQFCQEVHQRVYDWAQTRMQQGKILAVIGGDHSSPLGLIRAIADQQSFGILQIDAHMDLRNAYEGFTFSHASIMYNALQEKGVTSLTQVGIRDFCQEEEEFVRNSEKPVSVFYDENIYRNLMDGKSWNQQVVEMLSTLPDAVYISFDMDGLIPSLCPNTGTPVAGGLEFNQVTYLLEQVVRSGRKVVGFDVSECGDAPWDANVASRIIFRLAALMGVSHKLLRFRES